MLAHLVTQRTPEIGLRLALGASRASVFKLVVGEGMLLTACGIVCGFSGAFVLTRLMTTMLYEISARDPWTFAAIPVILALVSLLACYLPTRRAMTVDPLTALRYE